jgi:hypothetical protein
VLGTDLKMCYFILLQRDKQRGKIQTVFKCLSTCRNSPSLSLFQIFRVLEETSKQVFAGATNFHILQTMINIFYPLFITNQATLTCSWST